MRAAALPLLLSWFVPALRPAQDPPAPPGGFPIASRDYAPGGGPYQPVTWVDGARTSLEIYYPTVTPPPTGWPCVLLFHGTGGDRNIPPVVARANYLAHRGYICIAYDLRKEGSTVALNAGLPLFDASEPARMRDIAEASQRVQEWLPANVLADTSRLAVSGESMGGRQAYRAAAWSGQPLPPAQLPSGVYTHMPVIAAIAPRVAPLDLLGNNVRDGILMNAENAEEIAEGSAANPSAPIFIALSNEDYTTVAGLQALSVTNDYFTRLQSSAVPMLISNVWDDAKHPTLPISEGLLQLPPTTPVQMFWTTNGHSSAGNDWEWLANDEKIRRWFDRYVKGFLNGVDHEPRCEIACPPSTYSEHLTTTHPWGHAVFAQWPPLGTTTQTLFLRETGAGRALAGTPPNTVEPGPVVSNLPNNYGMSQFLVDGRDASNLASHFTPESESYAGHVLQEDLELLGQPRFRARVTCTAGDFYLTVRLWSVPPTGLPKLLSAGTYGVRGGLQGQHDLTVLLDDVGVIVPAGHRLAVELTNLPIYPYAHVTFTRWVPSFVPSDTTVLLDPTAPAQITLPQRPRVHAFVAPRFRPIAASSPVASWNVSGGPSRAGQYYMVMLSQSGYSPGTSFAPEVIPLNLDFWTYAVAAAPTGPFFPGFSGLLDAEGKATATLDLTGVPLPPGVLGLRFTLAVLGLDGGGFWGGGLAEFDLEP